MPLAGLPTDYSILTMREDEFQAVISRMEGYDLITGTSGRNYAVGEVKANSEARRIAVTRCPQGNQASAKASREMLADVNPRFVFLCGIAGGVPSGDFGLGDVVVGDDILDFTVSAANADGTMTYATATQRPERIIASLLEILPAIRLTAWNAPDALITERPQEWGDPSDFATKAIEKKWLPDLEKALTAMKSRQQPQCVQGTIGSSDTLVKDPERLFGLLTAHRRLCAVEMEAAGMLHALSERDVPFLVARGLSDVVGVKRREGWTRYACATAASYLLALLRSGEADRLLHPPDGTGQGNTDTEVTTDMLAQKLHGMHEHEIDSLINTFLHRDPWKAVRRSPLGPKINDFVEWAYHENVLAEAYAWKPMRSP